MFPELVPYLLDSFNSLFSFNLEKDWESYLFTVLYMTSSVTTANSQTPCISNSSLIKEDRNPPSTSFPELLREGYSGVAKAMLVAVIVETSYLSGTLYPSLHLSQRYPIWRVWIVTVHHFTEAKSEILHGHMAYPTLQNRGFIQTYIFAMEYAKNSYNKVTHKSEWKVQSAITMTVIL